MRLVDVRHEQTATFAAEGWAKVTRRLGVAALTAGPGRHQRGQRADRGPAERLADGGRSVGERRGRVGARVAAGARPRPDRDPGGQARGDRAVHRVDRPGTFDTALREARMPHRGPTFVDVALDVFVNGTMAEIPDGPSAEQLSGGEPDPRVDRDDREARP